MLKILGRSWRLCAAAIMIGLIGPTWLTIDGNIGSAWASPPPGDVLRVGLNVALSGTGAFYGVPMLGAWKVIQAQENAKGGLLVGGHRIKIQLYIADNQWSPTKIRQIADQQILQDKVQITATTGDPQDPFVVPVSEPNKVILLDWTSNDNLIKKPNKYVLNGLQTAITIAPPFFKYLLSKHPDIKSAYGIGLDIQYDHNNVGWEEDAAKAAGLKWEGTTFYPRGTVDYSSILGPAIRANPGVIMLGSEAGATPAILETLKQLGYKGVIASATASENLQADISGAGSAAEGFYQTELFSWPLTPALKSFEAAYRKATHSWNPLAVAHWLSIQFLLKAIQNAGTIDDADKIMRAAVTTHIRDLAVPGYPLIGLGGAKLFGQARVLASRVAVNQAVNGKPTTKVILNVPVP